jgi:DNA-binding CsgD family transcriptional regulator
MTVADARVEVNPRPSVHTVPRPGPAPRPRSDDGPERWSDNGRDGPPADAEPLPDRGLAPDDREIVALLRQVLRRSRRGDTALTSADGVLLDVVVEGVRCLLVREPAPRSMAALSPREREIARMVSLGHTNKTIADVLEISLWTVSTHLRRVFAKLGVSTRAAMIGVLSGNPELLSPRPVSERDTGRGRAFSS